MRKTRTRAAATQTGNARSRPSKRRGAAAGTATPLRLRRTHEALLDLLVPLLQLLGIGGEEAEVGQFRLVGGVFHLGVAGVEPLAVRHHLLDLPGESKVREQARRVRVRGEGRDRARGYHQRHALLRVDDLHRITLLLRLVEGVFAAVHRHRALARGHHARRIHRRLHQHELVLGQGLEVLPAVKVNEREHVGGDDPAIAGMRGDHPALPLRVQEVSPGLRRLRGGDLLRVVGDHVHGGAEPIVVAVLVLEPGGEALHAGRRVAGEELLLLEQHVVPGVRGMDHVHVLDIRLKLLHHALEDALGAGAVHLDLDAGIGRLEELGHLFRAGECERGVPHHLTFLLRRLHPRRVLRGGGRGKGGDEGEQRDEEREKPGHGHLLSWARDASRSDNGAPAASP
jgi:hypothetical protein